jgi:hypothetical protein
MQPAPDDPLLQEALRALIAMIERPPQGLSWRIGERIDRAETTVFLLRAAAPSGHTYPAYYKIFHTEKNPEAGWKDAATEELRLGLSLAGDLTRRLAERSVPEGITPAAVLAVDPDQFRLVTRGIPGRHLAMSIAQAVTRRRRTAALEIYHRIGRACRLIDDLPAAPVDANRSGLLRHARRLDRLTPWDRAILTSRDVETLQRRFQDLVEHAIASGERITHAHGDLSAGNILTEGTRIGLLDFSWWPRFRGHDLAHFLHRLEHRRGVTRWWRSALAEAVIEGYGEPAVRSRPTWEIFTLERLFVLATDVRGRRVYRGWGIERALRALKVLAYRPGSLGAG